MNDMRYYKLIMGNDTLPSNLYKYDGETVWIYQGDGTFWNIRKAETNETFLEFPDRWPEITEAEFIIWTLH